MPRFCRQRRSTQAIFSKPTTPNSQRSAWCLVLRHITQLSRWRKQLHQQASEQMESRAAEEKGSVCVGRRWGTRAVPSPSSQAVCSHHWTSSCAWEKAEGSHKWPGDLVPPASPFRGQGWQESHKEDLQVLSTSFSRVAEEKKLGDGLRSKQIKIWGMLFFFLLKMY